MENFDLGKLCQLCKKENFKYKCPKCGFRSCSLGCSKNHVAEELCKPVERPVVDEAPLDQNKVPVVEFEDEHTIHPSKLAGLRESERVKSLLKNPHLRRILTDLDSSKSPWKDMGKVMLEPVFTEFADACLLVIEPRDEKETF